MCEHYKTPRWQTRERLRATALPEGSSQRWRETEQYQKGQKKRAGKETLKRARKVSTRGTSGWTRKLLPGTAKKASVVELWPQVGLNVMLAAECLSVYICKNVLSLRAVSLLTSTRLMPGEATLSPGLGTHCSGPRVPSRGAVASLHPLSPVPWALFVRKATSACCNR